MHLGCKQNACNLYGAAYLRVARNVVFSLSTGSSRKNLLQAMRRASIFAWPDKTTKRRHGRIKCKNGIRRKTNITRRSQSRLPQ